MTILRLLPLRSGAWQAPARNNTGPVVAGALHLELEARTKGHTDLLKPSMTMASISRNIARNVTLTPKGSTTSNCDRATEPATANFDPSMWADPCLSTGQDQWGERRLPRLTVHSPANSNPSRAHCDEAKVTAAPSACSTVRPLFSACIIAALNASPAPSVSTTEFNGGAATRNSRPS